MKTRLERCIHWPIAILVMSMIVMFVAPSRAQAQQDQSTTVDHGESLWSISAERLGPDATPEQISDVVQQIYALNRGLIGSDPNLVFVGQELLLPTDVAKATPSAPGPEMVRLSARKAPAAEMENPVPGVESSAGRNARAAELAAEPADLLDEPMAARVPAVRVLTTEDSLSLPAISASVGYFAELRANRYQVIGLGIIALTFLVAALMLWKLPMRRDVGYAQPWRVLPGLPTAGVAAQMYSSSTSYAPGDLPERAQRISPAQREDTLASVPLLLTAKSGLDSPAHRQGGSASSYRLTRMARQRTRLPRRGRTRSPERLLHGGVAADAYKFQIRRERRVALRDRRRSKPTISRNTAAWRVVRGR